MKRYLIFAGADYYASGGWGDFVSAHETLDEARAAFRETVEKTIPFDPEHHRWPIREHDWVQLIDLVTLEEIDTKDAG